MADQIVATKLVRNESQNGFRYALLHGDNHQYYAVRSEVPYFCFEGDTVDEARQTAIRAIKFYYDNRGKQPTPPAPSR